MPPGRPTRVAETGLCKPCEPSPYKKHPFHCHSDGAFWVSDHLNWCCGHARAYLSGTRGLADVTYSNLMKQSQKEKPRMHPALTAHERKRLRNCIVVLIIGLSGKVRILHGRRCWHELAPVSHLWFIVFVDLNSLDWHHSMDSSPWCLVNLGCSQEAVSTCSILNSAPVCAKRGDSLFVKHLGYGVCRDPLRWGDHDLEILVTPPHDVCRRLYIRIRF